MSPVSVPEKTLEHWASQYIVYRYRSKASIWWPASGQDIDVHQLPDLPGKAVQLELKTTTLQRTGNHVVLIDPVQLWHYRRRPFVHRPFYAIPSPHWKAELATAARGAGQSAPELAFSRSGSTWWFAEWMIVLTVEAVADTLGLGPTPSPRRPAAGKMRLARFQVGPGVGARSVTWGPSGRSQPPAHIAWRDFWSRLEACGDPGWPGIIRLPTNWLTDSEGLSRETVRDLLGEAASMMGVGDWPAEQELTTFEAQADGRFMRRTGRDEMATQERRAENDENHRQVVFLDARAIQPDGQLA